MTTGVVTVWPGQNIGVNVPGRRVAFFSDSFHEINGVALTSPQFEAFARSRQLPFFSVHAGTATGIDNDGSVTVYDLQRGPAAMAIQTGIARTFRRFGPEA